MPNPSRQFHLGSPAVILDKEDAKTAMTHDDKIQPLFTFQVHGDNYSQYEIPTTEAEVKEMV